jgi:hypothetical protein
LCILISQNYGQYILYLVYIQIKEARISGSHTKIKKEREREKKRKRERKKERTNKRTQISSESSFSALTLNFEMNKTGFNINEEMFESVSFFNCY